MTRFVQAEYPVRHDGVIRVTRGLQFIAGLNVTHAVLHALAFLGSPVTRAGAKVRGGFAAFGAARKQRREDEKLWNIALSDARVMADLSRAMSREAARDVRGYY